MASATLIAPPERLAHTSKPVPRRAYTCTECAHVLRVSGRILPLTAQQRQRELRNYNATVTRSGASPTPQSTGLCDGLDRRDYDRPERNG